MNSFFGQPPARLALILAALLIAGLLALAGLALRHPVLFRLGARNVGRRKTQTLLIALGLMLSTMLITAALGVGDVIGGTIQAVAVGTLGRTDEVAYAPNGRPPFPLAQFDGAAPALRASAVIAGAMPVAVQYSRLLADVASRQIATVDILGVPGSIPPIFGPLHGPGGMLIDPATLGPDDVLVNPKLAEALAPTVGDRLYYFHDGKRSLLRVRALFRAPGITGIRPVAVMGLAALARLSGWPGQANAVMVANQGTAATSAGRTDEATAALEDALPGFEIDQVKQRGVDTFAHAQDIFTRVFLLFTLFAGGISTLLIVLVFSLLAAERRAEMGVARALGTGRAQLVQTFLFEGAIYDLAAAAIGVGAGLGLGTVLTGILSGQLTTFNVGVAGQVQPHSLALAYSLGALATGLTIILAAWSIGRLNIVAAMRGLSDEQQRGGLSATVRRVWKPLRLAGRALARRRPGLLLRVLLRDLPLALIGLAWRLVVGGLPLLPGLRLLRIGLDDGDPIVFSSGATLTIVGAMLLLRLLLRLARLRPRLADRLAFTPGGLALLGYWALPPAQFDAWGWPRFQSGVEVFFIAGLMMVAGAVLAAIYNIDLALRPVLALLTALGRAATARAALAYPLQHKGRSGLALAMFSLVAFTLTVMAVIIGATGRSYGDLNAAGNGFELQAQTAFGAIPHVEDAADGLPYLPRGIVGAAAASTLTPVGVVQLAAPRPGWTLYALNRVGTPFLAATTLHLATRAAGYDSDGAVWRALRTRPDLAVVDAGAVESSQGYAAALPIALPPAYSQAPLFNLATVRAEDRSMAPAPLWVADLTAGRAVRLTVIGVVDSRAANTYGIITSQRNLAGAGFPAAAPTAYYFKVAPGVDPHAAARRIEAAYLDYGLQVTVVSEVLYDGLGPKQVLSAVLEGFVGLTLLMGVMALALIAARAVVERRHSVGTMRALGYTRRMVGTAFLAEALFTAALGLSIGGVLGLLLSKNLFDANFFEQYKTGLTYAIPWPTLGVIAAAALAATLLATLAPAWQASRIAPAEALRYE